MNVRTLLLAPLRATHRAMHWMTVIVLALCMLVVLAYALFGHHDNLLWVTVGIYSGALFYIWAFFFASIILLAMDAKWLCIPGMQRSAATAVVLYAVLGLLPTFALAALFGGDVLRMCLVSLLCMLGGLSFALLPRYFAMCMGVLPALRTTLADALHVPAVSEPRFVLWAATLALILIAICVERWRAVVATAPRRQFGFTSAMVLQYRRNQWSGMQGMDSTQQVRQRPDWMQPRADLRHVGPQQPGTTMRVALGGWYLPKTLKGHLQGIAPALLVTIMPFTVMYLIFSQNHAFTPHFWATLTAIVIGWVGMFGSLGAMFMTVMVVQQRWRKHNSELPLLALLPGLGDAEASKRHLLMTVLRRPLALQLVSLLAIVITLSFWHPSSTVLLMITLGQLGCAAALVACLLGILGGRPLPGWATVALMMAISLLIGCDSFLPSSMIGSHPWVPATSFIAAVLGGWLAVGLALSWIGRRSWTAWRARPHTFMPNR